MKKICNGKEVENFDNFKNLYSGVCTIEITGNWLGAEDSEVEPEDNHTVGMTGVDIENINEAISSISQEFEKIEKIEIFI